MAAPSALEPRGKASERRRLRILDAAAQCFAKSGYHRARMDDVAAAAGVSRALVYNHFGSKEGLLHALHTHMMQEWWDAIERFTNESSAADALSLWIRSNLTDTRRRTALTAILSDGAWNFVEGWEETAKDAMRRWHAQLVTLLQRGIDAGEFSDEIDPDATADVLRAMQIGLIEHLVEARPGLDVSGERHVRAAIDVMVGSLLPRGPATPLRVARRDRE